MGSNISACSVDVCCIENVSGLRELKHYSSILLPSARGEPFQRLANSDAATRVDYEVTFGLTRGCWAVKNRTYALVGSSECARDALVLSITHAMHPGLDRLPYQITAVPVRNISYILNEYLSLLLFEASVIHAHEVPVSTTAPVDGSCSIRNNQCTQVRS